ncbi:hypothetical protein DBV15_01394 [Temnothorax longispinosus]|uniref:Uncharacterized protein n=1 Tax=Temnothorax longispinosus TaxID=300112 RepID=A0A4S2KZU5_9HYME|nr:hypothetical protein DBV15_01394 [Temnothorax longispinosus]
MFQYSERYQADYPLLAPPMNEVRGALPFDARRAPSHGVNVIERNDKANSSVDPRGDVAS